MKRGLLLSLFLCSMLWGQWPALPPNQKPMLGNQFDLSNGRIGIWLLNESSGTIVNDALRMNSSASVVNAVWSVGPYGSCLSFDGSGDYVEIPNNGTQSNMKELTVIVRGRSTTASQKYVMLKPSTYGILRNADGTFNVNLGTDDDAYAAVITNTGLAPINTWFTVAFTYRSGDARLYVNGVQAGEPVTSVTGDVLPQATWPLDISYSVSTWQGQIDYMMVFNRCLSSGDIASLYSNPFAGFHVDPIDQWLAALGGGVILDSPFDIGFDIGFE